MAERHAPAPGEYLYPLEDVPEVCPWCGQRINTHSPDQIAHHRTAPHRPFSGSAKKGRKRRWQASP